MASFAACVFGFWPLVFLEMRASGYGFRGLWVRLLQEVEIANGATEEEIRERRRI